MQRLVLQVHLDVVHFLTRRDPVGHVPQFVSNVVQIVLSDILGELKDETVMRLVATTSTEIFLHDR